MKSFQELPRGSQEKLLRKKLIKPLFNFGLRHFVSTYNCMFYNLKDEISTACGGVNARGFQVREVHLSPLAACG